MLRRLRLVLASCTDDTEEYLLSKHTDGSSARTAERIPETKDRWTDLHAHFLDISIISPKVIYIRNSNKFRVNTTNKLLKFH